MLIDEAHRTQEGNLGVYMRVALPHAFYFGYTGTPIDKGKVGKGTFEKIPGSGIFYGCFCYRGSDGDKSPSD